MPDGFERSSVVLAAAARSVHLLQVTATETGDRAAGCTTSWCPTEWLPQLRR